MKPTGNLKSTFGCLIALLASSVAVIVGQAAEAPDRNCDETSAVSGWDAQEAEEVPDWEDDEVV